jgi:lysozyme
MSKLQRVEALMARPIAWPVHRDAVRLIAWAEDCRLSPYHCAAGMLTIGWGETAGVKPGLRWTQEQADARFLAALTEFTASVQDQLTQPATDEQLGAMVSLAYNIGLGPKGFPSSSVLRLHNRGDHAGAARSFGLWNKYRKDGVLTVSTGLTARRATEAALYLRRDPEAPTVRPVQAVESESSLAASPIAQGGAVTAGAGIVSVLGEFSEAATPVRAAIDQGRGILEAVGVPPGWLLPAVLIAAGVAVVWWRWKQRRGGWA